MNSAILPPHYPEDDLDLDALADHLRTCLARFDRSLAQFQNSMADITAKARSMGIDL